MADDNMHLYLVEYLGFTAMDKRFSRPMLPWVVAEIKRRGSTEKVCLGVHEGCVVALSVQAAPGRPPVPVLRHPLAHVSRLLHAPPPSSSSSSSAAGGNAAHHAADPRTFLYVVRDPSSPLLFAHLFRATDAAHVAELFAAMRHEQTREDAASATAAAAAGVGVGAGAGLGAGNGGGVPGRSLSCASTLTALPADISPCSSHFFEVLYIGKIKVSHKKVPDTFIDDALEKFRAHELEKSKLKSQTLTPSNSNASEVLKIINQANCNGNESSNGNETGHSIIITLDGENGNVRRDSQDSNGIIEDQSHVAIIESSSNTTAISTTSCENNDLNVNANNVNDINSNNSFPDPQVPASTPIPTIAPAPTPTPAPVVAPAPTLTQSESENQNPSLNTESRSHSPPQDSNWNKQNIVMDPMRNRAASTGSARELKKSDTSETTDHNRIMLFQVGRSDLHLISPDRKQILLHKLLKDVASCIQGIQQADHFGFICRESNVDCYIAYVFKCQSESVTDDVVSAITQAFLATNESQRRERTPVFSCEHCPMMWYHKLCSEIEGLNDKKTTSAIFRKLEFLPEEEQTMILMKFRGAETNSPREQNEFLMMLLRAHCESKQIRHVHDTAENRHEFLNQYLGGSTIFMKAKRSLTSSFDQLLKRKGSRDDFGPIVKELSLPVNAALCKEGSSPGSHSPTSRVSPGPVSEQSDDDSGIRRRSSTVGTASGETMKKEFQSKHSNAGISPSVSQQNLPASPPNGPQLVHQKSSPMMNIFFKVGNTPKTSPTQENHDVVRQSGSWRQAIFNRVVTPNKSKEHGLRTPHKEETSKRDRSELRALWKKAINQQLLLIRMEKENARLRARQEEATVKRIKLEYEEISPCKREVVEVWDLLISKESRITAKCDSQMLLQAIKQGVPRSKRGEVWQFLAEQHCLKMPPIDVSKFPNYNIPYESLLKQLTSHPHNILVDLGRTFPSHTYFASPLGPGQLALFNLLKAYSLLDPEVGYCQGLNFVAGVLLLHMSEDLAFFLLKHLMFRRGLRRQYLPDMAALQVQLYQLSRLLHDLHPDLYAHFDTHEIAPTLYAAPWILTVFASQFPLGFVTRVYDLIFLESPEVEFRVALALLGEHKLGLLRCDNFEEIMGYLKTQITNVDKPMLDKIMKQVFLMDISKQLHEYEVEYHVLQEEMASPRPEYEDLHRLEETNRLLASQNQTLTEQLEIATSNIHRLENTRSSQQASINRLESQIRSLEVSILAMGNFISGLIDSRTDIEIPGDVRRLVSQLSTMEQRRNSILNRQNILNTQNARGVPLKVIDSVEVYSQKQISSAEALGLSRLETSANNGKQPRRPTHQLKSTISSPNLSSRLNSMSSFFGNSHNSRQQQLKDERVVQSSTTSSFIDSNRKSTDQNLSQMPTKQEDKSCGPISVSTERSDENLQKANSVSLPIQTSKLKPSLSAFELGRSINTSDVECSSDSKSNQVHPLDTCLGVNFTYGGTTKLKTIRPLRAQLSRNASSDSLKVVKNPSDAGSSVGAHSCSIAESNSEVQNENQTFSQSKPTLLSR